ncbi:putative signal transducing protein [Aquimarina sp. SS2-1]|uniref:putative signal transducing protein n=1 Tax=Aquimarina besae TaxID=3342247 RepID=UPI0036733EBD
MNKYIKIYTGTSILVNRIVFLLEQANIFSVVKDHKESGRLAGFGTLESSTELFVYDHQTNEASEIIEKFKKEILK